MLSITCLLISHTYHALRSRLVKPVPDRETVTVALLELSKHDLGSELVKLAQTREQIFGILTVGFARTEYDGAVLCII